MMEIPLSSSGGFSLAGMEVNVDSMAAIHPSQLSISAAAAANSQLQHISTTVQNAVHSMAHHSQQQQQQQVAQHQLLHSPNNNNNTMSELTVNTNTMAAVAAITAAGGGGGHYQQLPSDGSSSSGGGGGSSMISSHISSLMSDPCTLFSGANSQSGYISAGLEPVLSPSIRGYNCL